MLETIKELWNEAWPLIAGWLATNGAVLITMLVSWIKTKIKNFNLEKEIAAIREYTDKKIIAATEELTTAVVTRLDILEQKVVAKVDDNEVERQKKIDATSKEFEKALEELKNSL